MRRIVIVQRRYATNAPWQFWAAYDCVAAMRADQKSAGCHVPVSHDRWHQYPWTWTDEYGGEYRAQQRPLFTLSDRGGIDGGFLLAVAVILAVVLVYVAAGGAR